MGRMSFVKVRKQNVAMSHHGRAVTDLFWSCSFMLCCGGTDLLTRGSRALAWGAALKPLDWAVGLGCCFSGFILRITEVYFFERKRSSNMGPLLLLTLPPHLTHRLITIIL